jgi:hypothetical protein
MHMTFLATIEGGCSTRKAAVVAEVSLWSTLHDWMIRYAVHSVENMGFLEKQTVFEK